MLLIHSQGSEAKARAIETVEQIGDRQQRRAGFPSALRRRATFRGRDRGSGGEGLKCIRPPKGPYNTHTASFAALTGRALTIFRAGLALNIIGSPLNGLVPAR